MFQGRLPCKDKGIVDALRTLIERILHDKTRASPNQKGVVKQRIGKINCEPNAKHFLDMTQTQFYEMFLQRFPQIKISQFFFEMKKPFYVKINHTHTTCCCRFHVEFSMHYDVYCYICCTFYTNDILQECGLQVPPKTLK